MYEDFKDLISTHWYVVSKGRPTPEINLLEERITALEEDLNVKDDLFNMRQSYLPKEKRMSDKDRTDLYFLKKKYPLLFKDEKLQNVKEFFIEALSYKQTPTPQVKVIERELTQEDHYDLHTMMKLKDDEVN
jgi:hypothetical protein